MFCRYNACFHLKDICVVDLQPLNAPEGIPLRDEPVSPVLQWAPLTSISNHPVIPQLWLTRFITLSRQTHRYKCRGLGAEMRLCTVVGLVCVPLCLCAACVLQGCPSALLLVWRRGLLWQANHDQLGPPAHKE